MRLLLPVGELVRAGVPVLDHAEPSLVVLGKGDQRRFDNFGPLSDRPFRLLWLAATTSAVGSAFVTVALAFAVLGIGGTATSLGLVLLTGTIAGPCCPCRVGPPGLLDQAATRTDHGACEEDGGR
jgi:hypothetical protein